MSEPNKPRASREITYQVGWKKGTIHKKEPIELKQPQVLNKGLLPHIWHKAPVLPAVLDGYFLFILPIISILAIGMLIYYLNHY